MPSDSGCLWPRSKGRTKKAPARLSNRGLWSLAIEFDLGGLAGGHAELPQRTTARLWHRRRTTLSHSTNVPHLAVGALRRTGRLRDESLANVGLPIVVIVKRMPNQGWDVISITVGGAFAVVMVVILGVPIAKLIRDKLYARRMRHHFSDTRGRRRRLEDTTYWEQTRKLRSTSAGLYPTLYRHSPRSKVSYQLRRA